MAASLFDALIAPHTGNDTVFLELDDGRTLTFRAFVARAARMAGVLAQAGVVPGDRVVVQTPKLADTLALYAGALQAGAVYLPLNTGYGPDEVTYFIEDASPRLVVCDPSNWQVTEKIASRAGAQVMTLGHEGGSLTEAADDATPMPRAVSRAPDDLAALLYTSGTTGRSKGAMMSHRNLLSNARALVDLWGITAADRLIHALPIFHTHGLFVAINTALLAGARVRLMEKFDAGAVLAELPRSTLLMGVPTFYTRLLAEPGLTREVARDMRLFISGSAPLLAETHAAFETRTGHAVLERYGMTETNMITSNPLDGARVAGSVGFPLPGCEVRVTDAATGRERPRGETGMIEVRGENVFSGYWNMPQKTAEEIRPDGFFLTGDLGVIDDEGRVSIVGRAKDLIITGGLNVYPKEVEDVLNRIAGVVESAVFGVRDADMGEAVTAALVMAPGTAADVDAIARQVSERLARFKCPRRFEVLDELPRNTMGKVQKNVLRARFGG